MYIILVMNIQFDLRARLDRWAAGRNILILLGLFLLFTLVIFPALTARLTSLSNGVSLIDSEFSYTPEKAYQMISAYTPEGRQLYMVSTLTADLVYPLVYALFLSLAMIYFYRKTISQDSPLQGAFYIPFAAMLADYLENVCLVILLSLFPQWVEGLAQAANIFTGLKWGLLLASILLVLIGLGAWLMRRKKENQ
jgi:hypothetical protein